MEYGDYQLRYAAGTYWLLNTKQRGLGYTRPLSLNECGAHIWQMLLRGDGKTQIADWLCAEYGIERDDAMGDIEDFLKQLETYCTANLK